MSDIVRARELIQCVLDKGTVGRYSRSQLKEALELMHREPCIQNVKREPQRINWRMRRTIRRLKGKYTIHEIANIVGLRNSGRVSEVLHGKR